MSLTRLIFYSALIGGWAAFAGWLVCEILFLHRTADVGWLSIFFTAGFVGAGIAGGLMLLGALAAGSLRGHLHRLWPGLAGGFIAGAVGGTIGNLLVVIMPDVTVLRIIGMSLGWCVMGLCIGMVEGIWDQSKKKIINGLIGGSVGGLLGGILFLPLALAIGTAMSGRAVCFVILGASIGLFIGLAQVILKEAWLTVEEGFRPGRQLVLSLNTTILGTSEKAQLPFIAFGAKGVEPIHLRILREDNGAYILEDNNSRTGTFLNGLRIDRPAALKNEDLIQLGPNTVRFREVTRHVVEGEGRRTAAPPVVAPPPVLAPAVAVAAGPPPGMKSSGGPPPLPPAAIKPAAPPSPPKPAAAPPGAVKPAAPRAAPPAAKQPAAPSPAPAPAAAGASAQAPGCPICGRIGPLVPNSTKRRCTSCGLMYG